MYMLATKNKRLAADTAGKFQGKFIVLTQSGENCYVDKRFAIFHEIRGRKPGSHQASPATSDDATRPALPNTPAMPLSQPPSSHEAVVTTDMSHNLASLPQPQTFNHPLTPQPPGGCPPHRVNAATSSQYAGSIPQIQDSAETGGVPTAGSPSARVALAARSELLSGDRPDAHHVESHLHAFPTADSSGHFAVPPVMGPCVASIASARPSRSIHSSQSLSETSHRLPVTILSAVSPSHEGLNTLTAVHPYIAAQQHPSTAGFCQFETQGPLVDTDQFLLYHPEHNPGPLISPDVLHQETQHAQHDTSVHALDTEQPATASFPHPYVQQHVPSGPTKLYAAQQVPEVIEANPPVLAGVAAPSHPYFAQFDSAAELDLNNMGPYAQHYALPRTPQVNASQQPAPGVGPNMQQPAGNEVPLQPACAPSDSARELDSHEMRLLTQLLSDPLPSALLQERSEQLKHRPSSYPTGQQARSAPDRGGTLTQSPVLPVVTSGFCPVCSISAATYQNQLAAQEAAPQLPSTPAELMMGAFACQGAINASPHHHSPRVQHWSACSGPGERINTAADVRQISPYVRVGTPAAPDGQRWSAGLTVDTAATPDGQQWSPSASLSSPGSHLADAQHHTALSNPGPPFEGSMTSDLLYMSAAEACAPICPASPRPLYGRQHAPMPCVVCQRVSHTDFDPIADIQQVQSAHPVSRSGTPLPELYSSLISSSSGLLSPAHDYGTGLSALEAGYETEDENSASQESDDGLVGERPSLHSDGVGGQGSNLQGDGVRGQGSSFQGTHGGHGIIQQQYSTPAVCSAVAGSATCSGGPLSQNCTALVDVPELQSLHPTIPTGGLQPAAMEPLTAASIPWQNVHTPLLQGCLSPLADIRSPSPALFGGLTTHSAMDVTDAEHTTRPDPACSSLASPWASSLSLQDEVAQSAMMEFTALLRQCSYRVYIRSDVIVTELQACLQSNLARVIRKGGIELLEEFVYAPGKRNMSLFQCICTLTGLFRREPGIPDPEFYRAPSREELNGSLMPSQVIALLSFVSEQFGPEAFTKLCLSKNAKGANALFSAASFTKAPCPHHHEHMSCGECAGSATSVLQALLSGLDDEGKSEALLSTSSHQWLAIHRAAQMQDVEATEFLIKQIATHFRSPDIVLKNKIYGLNNKHFRKAGGDKVLTHALRQVGRQLEVQQGLQPVFEPEIKTGDEYMLHKSLKKIIRIQQAS